MKKEIEELLLSIREKEKEMEEKLIGSLVRITKFYNGQAYGTSHKNRVGHIGRIVKAIVCHDHCYFKIEGLEHLDNYCDYRHVEFLEEVKE